MHELEPLSALGKRPVLAVLTPPGRGAIATIAVAGQSALALVARRFQALANKPLEAFAVGSVVVGRFRAAAASDEELVVGLPGPERAEIHCHGGSAAVTAICEALVAEGGTLLTPTEWASLLEADSLSAAALLSLAETRTARTAAVLLDQYRGALHAAVEQIERMLAAEDGRSAAAAVDDLLARAEFGWHLTKPWKIVLAGRPNAGKSSLMNAIVGFERSIVFAEPGTTRDVLTATTALAGWPVELVDTAGLRASANPLEAEGVARAEQQIAAADLVLWIAETTAEWDVRLYQHVQILARRAGRRRQPPVLVVHNKCDLTACPSDGRPAGHEISAATGLGIDALCQAVIQSLIPQPPPRGAPVPFTGEQVAALQAAAADVSAGSLASAQQRLTRLRCVGPPALDRD